MTKQEAAVAYLDGQLKRAGIDIDEYCRLYDSLKDNKWLKDVEPISIEPAATYPPNQLPVIGNVRFKVTYLGDMRNAQRDIINDSGLKLEDPVLEGKIIRSLRYNFYDGINVARITIEAYKK